VTKTYYFGRNMSYAISPHEYDYRNPAIKLVQTSKPPQDKGHDHQHHVTYDVQVCLSRFSLGHVDRKAHDESDIVDEIRVRLFLGDAFSRSGLFIPTALLGETKILVKGASPRILTEASSPHCVGRASIPWTLKCKSTRIEEEFTLVATLECDATNQRPLYAHIASDACVAVYNTLAVRPGEKKEARALAPDHDEEWDG
jgi:hypothetical protein